MLATGIKGYQEFVVSPEDTAKAHKSGTLNVLATPVMVALMEETAWKSVERELGEGFGTVGIALHMNHMEPTPVGMKVWCESKLDGVKGRKLVFTVTVYDETGKVGEGMHERYVVEEEKFQIKADKKKEK
ncbi:MAG: hotdog domain-containing protein [Lachnospiraceae bacterium]